MGYEVTRFVGEVDEELLCTICRYVLQTPVQIRQCEHCFCSSCINEWLQHQQVCPIDRNSVTPMADLIQAPRVLRNMLSRLKITCDNKDFGCTNVVALEGLETHLTECSFNPKRLVQCEKGCSLMVPLDEVPQHSCIKKLHDLLKLEQTRTEDLTTKVDRMEIQLSEQALKVDRLEAQLSEQNRELLKADRLEIQLSEHNREILILKEMVRSLRVSTVFPRVNTTDETEKAIQTVRWLSGLKPARIKRWGGMISTPDDVLQSIIKRALQDSGCPAHMILELMNNAHERRWPCGLNTLESRQLNRQQCEQYVTKRVPGKQAVVIMAMENEHMGESMVTYPGLIIIFAHGVE